MRSGRSFESKDGSPVANRLLGATDYRRRPLNLSSRQMLSGFLPVEQDFLRVLCEIRVDQLCARLAEPDAVRRRHSLIWRRVGIESWSTLGSSNNVRSNSDVDGLCAGRVRATGRLPALGVGAAEAYPASQEFLCLCGKSYRLDAWFDVSCPWPFRSETEQLPLTDEPEIRWFCNHCGAEAFDPELPCPACGYEQFECPICLSPVKDEFAACPRCGNDPRRQ